MLFRFLKKFFSTLIILFILSIMSYLILLRNPIYYIEDSIFLDYFRYINHLIRGDFGYSYNTSEPLAKQIIEVFPATMSLTFSAILLSLVIGIPLGFLAVIHRNNLLGKSLLSLSSLSLAIPVFWLAIILLAYASLKGWQIAAVGIIHPIYDIQRITGIQLLDILFSDSEYRLKMLQSALHHLVLPTLVLMVPAMLQTIQHTADRAEYVLKQNYVKIAQARGWSAMKIWRIYVLRNTLPALVPMIAHNITLVFAFGMLVENVVSWGGIGRWLINALSIQDYPAISAGVMAIGLFVLFIDIFAGLLKLWLDPSYKKDWYNVK